MDRDDDPVDDADGSEASNSGERPADGNSDGRFSSVTHSLGVVYVQIMAIVGGAVGAADSALERVHTAGSSIPSVRSSTRSRASNAIEAIRELPSRLRSRLKVLLLGPADTYGTRIGTAVLFLATALLAVGLYGAMTAGLDASGDSSWFMARVVGVLTSLWTYAILAFLFVGVVQVARRKRAAQRAASKTGFSVRTCLRLAAEARTADGAQTTVEVSPADTVASSAERILAGFDLPNSVVESGADRDDHTIDEDIVDAADESADSVEETGIVVNDRASVSPSEHARLTRLEFESTLNFRDVFWTFVVPAVATMVGALILVQFWVAVWVYALIFLIGILVGASWYLFVHWQRRRHAQSLRGDSGPATYNEIGVVLKRVETPDVTAYYGWVGGTLYADYNVVRLAWTLSEVAHANIEGEQIPPTIQEKFGRNLRQYTPNLKGYEEAVENPEIIDALVEQAAKTETKMIPKNRLPGRVIARDKQRVGGVGYDPRLVAECYESIVPYALVEEDVEVSTPTEGENQMTVVRLRTHGVPPEVARTEAQFSVSYQPDFDPDFPLPEVDLSTEEPIPAASSAD